MTHQPNDITKFLLKQSPDIPVPISPKEYSTPNDQQLSPEKIRKDIALFARLLINVYGGYPIWPEKFRTKILNKIYDLYTKAELITDSTLLFRELGKIIQTIPDKHIMIKHGKNNIMYPRKPTIECGENLSGDKPYKMYVENGIGIIALSSFPYLDTQSSEFQNIRNTISDIMSQSNAIILDLRNNGGGCPHLAAMIADTLLTPGLPHSKRMLRRNNSDACSVYKHSTLPVPDFANDTDPDIQADNTKFKIHGNPWQYQKPIYVLMNNRSASSAERLITFMKYNKKVVFVGSNSSGCLQYTNYLHFCMPESGILFRVPTVYKEVPGKLKHFETRGFPADINCSNQDAFAVALQHLQNRSK